MVTSNDNQVWIENRMEQFQAKCRSSKLRITPQRVAIYQVLLETKEHPSAESVCKQVRKTYPNISLDTVNRTLLTLNAIGAAFIVEGSGDAKRFDGNTDNHQHFKCVQCKRIFDIFHEPYNHIEDPKCLSKNFKVLRKTVYFEGLCDACNPS